MSSSEQDGVDASAYTRPVRVRSVVGALLAATAVVVGAAACSSDDDESTAPPSNVPALKLKGDATRGRAVWTLAGCSACHTLAAAKGKGTVGPSLDKSEPSFELVATRVTLGQRGMPRFEGLLTNKQIADVAQFVAASTGGQ